MLHGTSHRLQAESLHLPFGGRESTERSGEFSAASKKRRSDKWRPKDTGYSVSPLALTSLE